MQHSLTQRLSFRGKSNSALKDLDERKAMEVVRANRDIHKRIIKKHKGRWLKEMAEGVIVVKNITFLILL